MNTIENAIELERRYSAHNYAPLPVVLTRGQGAHLWDTAGRLRRHDERLRGPKIRRLCLALRHWVADRL